jgi:hypothetical protein
VSSARVAALAIAVATKIRNVANPCLSVRGQGIGLRRADDRRAPPVEDDRRSHPRSQAQLTYPCGSRTRRIVVAVYPGGALGSQHHRRNGLTLADNRSPTRIFTDPGTSRVASSKDAPSGW